MFCLFILLFQGSCSSIIAKWTVKTQKRVLLNEFLAAGSNSPERHCLVSQVSSGSRICFIPHDSLVLSGMKIKGIVLFIHKALLTLNSDMMR